VCVLHSAALSGPINGSSLLAIAGQIDLLFPAGPGVDFSRPYRTQKCVLVPEGRKGMQ
jgi:hypothetical protein